LYEGRFRAAVDVFPEEPPRPDHPIRNAPNVILSAHRAGSISDALRNIGRITADDVEALAAGLPPMHMQVVRAETIGHMG
jgi:phosphoglycerate dehydrogenase-like enzyme